MPQASPEQDAFDVFEISDDQHRLAYDTWQALMKTCMNDQGFEFAATPWVADTLPPFATSSPDVARLGYQRLSSLPQPENPNDLRLSDDAGFRRAFLGDEDDPFDGCRDRAAQSVYGEDNPYIALLVELEQARGEIGVDVDAGDAYGDLNRRWAECMALDGFDFAAPSEALERFYGQDVTPQEVATRMTDLRCQAAVSYELSYSQLMNTAKARWIDQHPELVASLRLSRDEYLRALAELHGRACAASPSC